MPSGNAFVEELLSWILDLMQTAVGVGVLDSMMLEKPSAPTPEMYKPFLRTVHTDTPQNSDFHPTLKGAPQKPKSLHRLQARQTCFR